MMQNILLLTLEEIFMVIILAIIMMEMHYVLLLEVNMLDL